MKRDVDLSRAILRFVEEHAPPQGGVQKSLSIESYDRPTVLAHAELLIEDGLIDGEVKKPLMAPVDVLIIKLTSRGHDAIQAIENDTLWSKVKKTVEYEQGCCYSTVSSMVGFGGPDL